MQLFYAPDIATNPLLPEEESRHCTKVLRLTVDDTLMLTDGKGSFYRAVIAEPHPKYCRVTVVEHLPQAPLWPFRIHLAVAPTKNIDRMEWFLEKATEVCLFWRSFPRSLGTPSIRYQLDCVYA